MPRQDGRRGRTATGGHARIAAVTAVLFAVGGAGAIFHRSPGAVADGNSRSAPPADARGLADIPAGLVRLQLAYPDFVARVERGTLVFHDGSTLVWDRGGKGRSAQDREADPDLREMMAQDYIASPGWVGPPPPDSDPGRLRCREFFERMYGSSRSAVMDNLTTIRWLPTKCDVLLRVTTVNGVVGKLAAISAEIESTLGPEYNRYFRGAVAGFSWRTIEHTDRLSPHAFGIAIDIGTTLANYWAWENDSQWKNQIPDEIVRIFERHGFIWGGKWAHYDTMHFEYRPELLVALPNGKPGAVSMR